LHPSLGTLKPKVTREVAEVDDHFSAKGSARLHPKHKRHLKFIPTNCLRDFSKTPVQARSSMIYAHKARTNHQYGIASI